MDIKVMTFNLRVDNSGDGGNSFFHRVERIKKVLADEAPELVGFQEVTNSMRRWIIDNVPGYVFQGCGREANYHGEAMLLGYGKDIYELISLENHWLSDTPEIPGSNFGGDQSGCPRMFTSVKLKRDGVDRPFVFINTHLDHVGKTARLKGSKALIEYMKGLNTKGYRVILTGDFNATPDTPEIKIFSETWTGLHDCTENLGGTFHDFGRVPEGQRDKIDYVFSNAGSHGAYIVPDEHPDGIYYSDHFAVCTYIEL